MKSIVRNGTLYFEFSGEFDNVQVNQLRFCVTSMIDKYRCPIVKFDFKTVEFVDSTGIGFVLARYNQIRSYGGILILKNIQSNVRKVFSLSGIFSIIQEERSFDKERVKS